MKKNKTSIKIYIKKDDYILSMENWFKAQDAYIEHIKRRCHDMRCEIAHLRKRLTLEIQGVKLAEKHRSSLEKELTLYKKTHLRGNNE